RDVSSPNLGIRFGPGWFAPDRYENETWRWAANNAVLTIDHRPDLPGVIALELEPGPGVGNDPFRLEVRDAVNGVVAAGVVRERQLVCFRLPDGPDGPRRYTLHVPDGDRPTPNDWRTLNHRLFDCQRVENWDETTDGHNFQVRPTPADLHGI